MRLVHSQNRYAPLQLAYLLHYKKQKHLYRQEQVLENMVSGQGESIKKLSSCESVMSLTYTIQRVYV